MVSRAKAARWGAALTGAGAATLGYAAWVEPRWLQLRRPRIHVRGLPAPLEGLRIALLTDLHAGRPRDYALIRRAVRMVMAEVPALIALTGDLTVDDAQDFSEVLAALDGLSAPLGVYAVPGNHDHIVGIGKWRRDIGSHPVITDLTNRSVLHEVDGARLCVAGVDDYFRGTPRLPVPPRKDRDFTLLLAHSPDQGERCCRIDDAVDLIVSGHTHGGQVRLPFLGAPVRSAAFGDLYDEGLRRRPWTQVYTSRGIGTIHLPVRLFARPEVAVLRLTGAPRPPRGLVSRLMRG